MSTQTKNILLVDDEKRLLSALRRRLSADFNIVTAASALRALEIIEEDANIAVIVADMQMPEMNGIELLKAVQQKAPAIRRLMLTGNADLETAMAAINDGKVMRFLRKPCDTEELKKALSQALSEHDFQTAETIAESQSEKASDAGERARTAFLSRMNHELRTPLNQIIGLANILETNPPEATSPDSIEHLKQIQASGEQMLHLINRILDFSRLQSASKPDGEPQIADVVQILNDEIHKIRHAAAKKNITISFDSLRRHAEIFASSVDTRTAIRELLDNATKFNSPNGHVSILVKCDTQNVAVKIIDTGCGISPTYVDEIQTPFRQGDESYSRRHEGIGLGLALVETTAKLNNARFSLKSQAQGGVEATLIFPRAAADGPRGADKGVSLSVSETIQVNLWRLVLIFALTDVSLLRTIRYGLILGMSLFFVSIQPSSGADNPSLRFQVIVPATEDFNAENEVENAIRKVAVDANWLYFTTSYLYILVADDKPPTKALFFCGQRLCFHQNPMSRERLRLGLPRGRALIGGVIFRSSKNEPRAISINETLATTQPLWGLASPD